MELIGLGAEASIYKVDDRVIKIRHPKKYRHPKIDSSIISQRTKRETKILKKLQGIAPNLYNSTDNQIEMELLNGDLVKNILNDNLDLAVKIAKTVTIMHNKNIVHGDLTTSNMIYDENIRIIDFGLSKVSTKIEDKAVDLHLLKQAIQAKHFEIEEKFWELFLKNYSPENKAEIIKRLEEVQSRGKNKK